MEYISHQIQNRVAQIVLNRPNKRNALNRAMILELYKIFSNLTGNLTVDSVVISANGSDFCAGADLNEMPDRTPEVKQVDIERANRLMDYIEGFAKPVTAVIHGHAIGGGLELALACHKRVSDETGVFGFPEATMGFLPAWGGTRRLPKLIGDETATRMIQTGICIDATQAEKWSLIKLESTEKSSANPDVLPSPQLLVQENIATT